MWIILKKRIIEIDKFRWGIIIYELFVFRFIVVYIFVFFCIFVG